MNIVVTGAEGLIGNQVANVFSSVKGMDVSPFGHKELDITECSTINRSLGKIGVQILINCAGTSDILISQHNPNLDDYKGPKNLADYCKARGIKMIQLSPSIVFDEPNSEGYPEDSSSPFDLKQKSVFARNKAKAELEVLNVLPDSEGIIVRSSKVFGSKKGGSYVKDLLNTKRIQDSVYYPEDDIGNPTYSKYLAWSLVHLVSRWSDIVTSGNRRVFHAVPNEVSSEFRQAKFTGVLLGIGNSILAGKRDVNLHTNPMAVLKNTRLFRLPSWEDGIRELINTP